MKHLKKFNESNKEKISMDYFVDSFLKTKFAIDDEVADDYKKSPKNTINDYIFAGSEMYEDELKDWEFEYVDSNEEKGDYKDETTTEYIFKRKSDGKFFKATIHDAGLIGPETLTIGEYLEEVSSKSKKVRHWE